jgi:2,4-dienoyl-CoA reductase-like NADH-dependent reductase (Old Yellow Enzyme family)
MPASPFDPYTCNGLELKNRFVMPAAASPYAADIHGIVTGAEIARIGRIAAGGVGLFITGAVLTHPRVQTRATSCMITNDAAIPAFAKLTGTVHQHGAKAACQLCNSGVWAAPYQETLGQEALGVSVLREGPYAKRQDFPPHYRPAAGSEIREFVRAFADGAARAKAAGFDAVEVHAAHDSIFSQFLSPLSNRRHDMWGGSLENRTRFHREALAAIRDAVGSDFPVLLKLGVQDALPGGLQLPEGIEAAKLCAGAGCDLIEVSMGLQGTDLATESVLRGPIRTIEQEGFTRAWCRAVKQETGMPTIMTGGLRSLELVEEVIAAGETDLVGLCRPMIREPGLVGRWQAGDRRISECTSCNLCVLKPKGEELSCVPEEE